MILPVNWMYSHCQFPAIHPMKSPHADKSLKINVNNECASCGQLHSHPMEYIYIYIYIYIHIYIYLDLYTNILSHENYPMKTKLTMKHFSGRNRFGAHIVHLDTPRRDVAGRSHGEMLLRQWDKSLLF